MSVLKNLLLFVGVVLFAPPGSVAPAQRKTEVPVVDARLGPCSAMFTARENHEPVYNAKISVTVRSGALGLRKTELEVGTNSEGQGRVAGLPQRAKKPLEFTVRHGELSKTVVADPSDKCEAAFEVDLSAK